ncbi:hypothetical protein ACWEKM_31315 [Streptomyces sp. NPDC004752]
MGHAARMCRSATVAEAFKEAFKEPRTQRVRGESGESKAYKLMEEEFIRLVDGGMVTPFLRAEEILEPARRPGMRIEFFSELTQAAKGMLIGESSRRRS